MSIRLKLFLTYLVSILLAVGIIGGLVSWKMNQYAEENFETLAYGQLKRIDEALNMFLGTGKKNAEYLANLPIIKNAMGKLPSYTATNNSTELLYSDYNAYQQEIYNEILRIHDSNKSYGLMFVGLEDGGFIQAPEKDTLGPGYDPRKRPWYKEAMSAPADVNISNPYTSSSGEVVVGITSKVYNDQKKLIGIFDIDISLMDLTNYLNTLSIGETGYIILADKTGTVLSSPKDSSLVGKNVSSIEGSAAPLAL